MKTIKSKMIIIFMINMFFLILCHILLNSIGLESYYIYKNKSIFISLSKEIGSEYINNKENFYEYINNIEDIENISTIIIDKDFNIEYNSNRQKKKGNQKRLPEELEQTIINNKEKLSKEFIYYIDEKNDDKKTKLVFVLQMSNGKMIILRKSFKNIREGALIANQFYILAVAIVIIIGIICILIFSKKMTKPIIEMSEVAGNISNLKFDQHINVKSKDEIGKLGESINEISKKLCVSINELKEDVERRKRLVRDISHELKTPIGIIKGYAEALKYGVVDDAEKMKKYCSVLVEECDRMDKLIFELLNHSMLESGLVKVNITSFDIYEFISKIVERFTPIFIDKGITFHLKCINNYRISADCDMLEKVINNFITNAINHVEGKNIIQLTATKMDNGIKVSVFNTGNHISIEDSQKIWDVYYKVDKARIRKYGGHGLELAIVKLIVELHNGIVSVENVQEGVVFSFEIPNVH